MEYWLENMEHKTFFYIIIVTGIAELDTLNFSPKGDYVSQALP